MDRDPICPNFLLRDMKELCLKYRIVVCPKSEHTRQMVLDTGNQEKETLHEGLLHMAPELPGAPSLFPNVPVYTGAPPPQKPTQVYPLVETGGEFGLTQAHKPFSELRQIKQDLGSYTDDPGKHIDVFQHIILAIALTYKDIIVIYSQTLSDPAYQSVQLSHSVVSDSLRLHESQHASPPCTSPTPRVYSNSCPSSQ